MPNQVKIHASDQPATIASRMAAKTPTKPPPGRYPIAIPVPKVSVAAMAYRIMSATIGPANGATREIGSTLNRSKTPLSMSSRIWVPVATQAVSTVCAMSPGISSGR